MNIRDLQIAFELAETAVRAEFFKDSPLRVECVRSASGSDEAGYFIFVAGGKNLRLRFFERQRVTVAAGDFKPGIYLVYDHAGGPTLSPGNRIEPSLLTKAWFRSGCNQADELWAIRKDFERFFADRRGYS